MTTQTRAQDDTRPTARSSFAAAFLSFLFPGLGQAYAGAWERALAFAAIPILLIALLAGVVLRYRMELLGYLIQPVVLVGILGFSAVVLVYRMVAVVDAYRVADYVNGWRESGQGRVGPPRRRANVLGLAGLGAILAVMIGGHLVVGYYGVQALDLVGSVFSGGDPTDDIVIAAPSPSLGPGETAAPSTPLPEATAAAATVTPTKVPKWDGKERLNILLVGADERADQGYFNTDTLIVVSIDPTTKEVAMFSLPRDTVDVPLPADSPARAVYGDVFGGKINSLCMAAKARPDIFPSGCFGTIKEVLGALYDLDIKYYVQVNFEGFTQVVDALGGVTVNVQTPVVDDSYPTDRGQLMRVYIPSGIQHMTGEEALVYARSRHGSSDFDRGQRQQRVILSLRQQADVAGMIPRIPDLVKSLKKAVHTDIPVDLLPQLAQLAGEVDMSRLRSQVFAPSFWATEVRSGDPRGYVIVPKVDRIRYGVRAAFADKATDIALREKVAAEGARVWVLNGTGATGQAADVASYLAWSGMEASAPNQKPDEQPTATVIRVYNGAETKMPQTVAYLEKVLKATVEPVTDPAVRVDVIV
ncbi:MAG: LCP family protein, partial [Chloroflexi bacterium]|nr:LCP family protein [Chloroflexota bacterium]